MKHFGMKTADSKPIINKPPTVLRLLPPDLQVRWLTEQSKAIVEEMCPILSAGGVKGQLLQLKKSLQLLESNSVNVNDKFRDGYYHCSEHDCRSKCKTKQGFERHLHNSHHKTLDIVPEQSEPVLKSDTLLQLLMLIYDLWDSLTTGDGNRIFRNIKLVFLYLFTSGHIKYRLWLWRMIAYDTAILSPKQAFEYRWNMCANIQGGHVNNIADDNLVEILIKKLKALLRSQGSNLNINSARTSALTMLTLEKAKDSIIAECQGVKQKNHKRLSKKKNDVIAIAHELMGSCVDKQSKHIHPFHKVDANAFLKWHKDQVLIACNFLHH